MPFINNSTEHAIIFTLLLASQIEVLGFKMYVKECSRREQCAFYEASVQFKIYHRRSNDVSQSFEKQRKGWSLQQFVYATVFAFPIPYSCESFS